MEAYCMKCKEKREMLSPQAAFNKSGAPVTRGVCPICQTALYRTGRTDAHAALTPSYAPVLLLPGRDLQWFTDAYA